MRRLGSRAGLTGLQGKSAAEKPGRDIRPGRKLRVTASRSRRLAPRRCRNARSEQATAVWRCSYRAGTGIRRDSRPAIGRGAGIRGHSRERVPVEWPGKHCEKHVERRHDSRANRAGRSIIISLSRLSRGRSGRESADGSAAKSNAASACLMSCSPVGQPTLFSCMVDAIEYGLAAKC